MLATPISIMVATGHDATQGVLFRDAVAMPGFDADSVLRLAVGLDQGSEHPLAHAIVRAARERGLAVASVGALESASGMGV